MQIHYDINPVLELSKKGKFLARADGYPDYKKTLSSQFDQTNKLYSDLMTKYNLEIRNFFKRDLCFLIQILLTLKLRKK